MWSMNAFWMLPALLFSPTTAMAEYDHCSTCTGYYPDASIEDPRSRWGTRRKLTSHACGVDGDTSDCCEFLPDINFCGVGVLHGEFVHPCGSCDAATLLPTGTKSPKVTKSPKAAPTIAPESDSPSNTKSPEASKSPKAPRAPPRAPKAVRSSTLTSITYE
jgi:hypothetical protein